MTGIIKRLFSKSSKNKGNKHASKKTAAVGEPTILTRDSHNVSRKSISKNALKVLYRLNDAGYQAYLVGGGVRDILLGLQPKDFDIATDATPEEVYKLFRNCRLIGRRFRLAHILYGREVIEVATFRAGHDESASPNKKAKNDLARTSDHGMLVRDNVYGSMSDDAFRRDFTVNALYYTVKDFSVVDYTQGLQDLSEKKLRLIGDPDARYTEDPVRILRAIRLACKLNLTIEKKTAAPIKSLAPLLEHVSSARLWDESNKMLLAGHAESTWNSLCENQVAQYLFPQTISSLNNANDPQTNQDFLTFITAALKNTDKRIANQQPVTPAFLFAVFLWLPQQQLAEKLKAKGVPPYEANQKAASKVMTIQCESIGIPKRFSMVAKEMWALQHRLSNLRKKSVDSLIAHQRFRAAYDFLCLRAGNDESLNQLANWWTEYQEVDAQGKSKLLKEAQTNSPKKRTRKPRKKKVVKRAD